MIIIAILHAAFEPLGAIQDWIDKHDHTLHIVKPYKGDVIDLDQQYDALIIMGGPQSPLEIEKFPYLKDEIAAIQHTIQARKKVLGFCLGAQLIGEALGATTARNPNKEIGVWPVTLTDAGQQDKYSKTFPKQFNVAHWHNDMPGLPQGAVVLAESVGCPRQIIRFTDNAYGFQCHPEMTLPVITRLCEKCESDLTPGKYIAHKDAILSANYDQMNVLLSHFLSDYFTTT